MSHTAKKIVKIGGMMAIVVIFFISIVVFITYFFNDDSILSQSMRRIMPVPAATINHTHWVSSAAVDDNLRALQHQYDNPQISESGLRVDFSTPDGEKRLLIRKKDILNKMVEDQAIMILAKDRGITIKSSDAHSELEELFSATDENNSAADQIQEVYNWDTDTFIDRIVLSSMYSKALEQWFYENNTADPSLEDKIREAKKELDDQRQFTDVVNKYSQEGSKMNEGEMGWFAPQQLMEEISSTAFVMQDGDISDVIETPIGYHIIRMNEHKDAEDEIPELVHLSQIFVAKKTFGQWLEEQMRLMTFRILAAEFMWDNERQVVDFRDQEMRNFEKAARNNPQGDASLF